MIDPQLQDKVVLITGANHGIGAAAARAFGRQGARIYLTACREPSPYSEEELRQARESGTGGEKHFIALQQQPLDSVLQGLRSQGAVAAGWEADLGKVEHIPELFDRCEEEIGTPDVLVNNHTYDHLDTFDPERAKPGGKWFGEYAVELIGARNVDRTFAVNTRAYALLMCEYVIRYWKRSKTWGRIINISTDAAHCHESNVSYAASKHAIESYTRSAAVELGKYGITVNVIAPGPIQTGYMTPEMVTNLEQGVPLRRVGRPEDVADVIVFLASVQARWLTGQLLYVGGGWRMHQ
ncbi:MAG: SDR family NAD(P)-dependent oxidoreductase [bacterium]